MEGEKKITLVFTASNYIMNLGKTIVVPATPMILFPVEIADVFMLGPSKKSILVLELW